MFNLEERKEGISKKELEETALRFRIGDEVYISAALIEDYDRENKEATEAVVQQICRHHIVFKLKKTGVMRSFVLPDCMNITVTKPSDFTVSGIDRKMNDTLSSMDKKEEEH